MVFPASAWSGTVRDDVPDSDYVALGNEAAFAAVGAFSSGVWNGSGILIDPDWVLTAAHLIGGSSATFTLNGTAYTSTQIFIEPGASVSSGTDLALVHLSSSLTAIPPAMLYTGPSIFGQTATFVGYGFTGTGLTGYQISFPTQKRGLQDVVDVNNPNLGNTNVVFGATFESPADGALPLEGCVAYGDSGGGAFAMDGSQYYLAGVISFVAATDGSANSSYSDISGFDSIAPAMPWITSVVPEPSTFTLLAMSAVALVLRRKCRFPKTQRF